MYNEILKLGPVTIYGYGLMIGIGVLAALMMADKRARRKGMDADLIFSGGVLSLFAGLAGAKLFYVILDWKQIIADENPLQAIVTGNGFVVYGGIITGVLTAMIYFRKKKIAFLPYFDLAAPSIAIAQGFGRLGCLLAGCCYGKETNSVLGIVFRHSAYAPNDVRLVPTQIISSLGNFSIMLILLVFARKEREAGKVGGLYLLLYAVGRFFIEFYRNDNRGFFGPLSSSQMIALVMLVPGVLLFFWPEWKKKSQQNQES